MTLCDAYQVIEPHFALWKYFFQLKSGSVVEYMGLPFPLTNCLCYGEWFYTKAFIE